MDEKYFTPKKKQYAIIGGGIYGCQIALSLSKVANTEVTIYEKMTIYYWELPKIIFGEFIVVTIIRDVKKLPKIR